MRTINLKGNSRVPVSCSSSSSLVRSLLAVFLQRRRTINTGKKIWWILIFRWSALAPSTESSRYNGQWLLASLDCILFLFAHMFVAVHSRLARSRKFIDGIKMICRSHFPRSVRFFRTWVDSAVVCVSLVFCFFLSLVQFCHSENLKLLQSAITCRAVLSGILLFLVRIDCNRFCLFVTSVCESQEKRHNCFFDTRLSVASPEMIDVVRPSQRRVSVRQNSCSSFIWSSSWCAIGSFNNGICKWKSLARHHWITAFNALHCTVTVSRSSQNSIVVFSAVAHTI